MICALSSKTVYCPWCRSYIRIQEGRSDFGSHVASHCPDAPESAKGAFSVAPYPPGGR